MNIKDRKRRSARRQACLLLLLSIGLAVSGFSFPAQLTAAGSRVAVTKNAASGLVMKTSPAPQTLQDFIQITIDKLAKEDPFKGWKAGQVQYYPLGPGTHSWLVNVMNGEQRIGYLVIAAKDEGGYMLSEYGAGNEGLPYSLSDLRQFLVQEGLISSTYSGTPGLTPLYSALLPVWEITIAGKKLYINAAVPEILPWTSIKAEAVLKTEAAASNGISDPEGLSSPQTVYRSGQSSDPYDDLLWLKNPKLPVLSGDAFLVLLQQKGSLVFQSAGRNDRYGAPFMITGYQVWTSATNTAETGTQNADKVYAAIGPQGKRFVPLYLLHENGTLHKTSAN
ncbi:hypothetical protein PaeBR_17125 [Paenibacillus sp. BR2-3]|uniref:hypothetical protein n=1 Tax=Paenibacillus sp. BR2-3 TaxID=3048494 RepID=UPI003977B8DA